MSVIETFADHQTRAIAMLDDVFVAMEAGMGGKDIRALAQERLKLHGFDRWFHGPEVDLGCQVTGREPRHLQPGSLVHVDIGPGSAYAFGDVGATFVFKGPSTDLVDRARALIIGTCTYASHRKVIGEMYVFANAWANNRQLKLHPPGTIGHACLPPIGLVATAWPTSAALAVRLRRHQIRMLNPRRPRGVFALHIPVTDGHHWASFEELIAFDEEGRRVLGRPTLDEVGLYSVN